MKNIKFNIKKTIALRTIIALTMVSVLMSCSNDFLDQKPLGDISDIDVFNNDQLLESYVNGNYRAFKFFQFGAFHKDGISDDAVNNAFVAYNRGLITPDFYGEEGGVLQDAWNHNYKSIRNTNIFFDRIEDSNASPELVKRLTGEMRFIRAWCYFDLINLFGDVPFKTSLFELGQESFDTPRTSYDEIVAFIKAEMDKAVLELPQENTGGTFNGRATRGAAAALRSRALLYAASELHNPSNNISKWEAARDAAKAAIDLGDYNIDPNYSNLFNKNISNEVMFARSFTQENPVLDGWLAAWNTGIDRYYLPSGYFGAVDTNFFKPLQSLVDAYETLDGSPVDPQNPWVNRDPRLDMTIIHHGSVVAGNTIEYHVDKNDPSNSALAGPASALRGGTQSNYNVLKQTDPNLIATFGAEPHENPWVFFRLAEMYLNYAEALIELGDDAGAKAAIQVVRSRANVSMPAFTESGNDLKTRYRNERRVELAFENHRWYDIIRWKIAPTVLALPAKGVRVLKDNTTNPATITYDYDDNIVDGLRVWDDKLYYLPIPRSEVEASPSITQNPGY